MIAAAAFAVALAVLAVCTTTRERRNPHADRPTWHKRPHE